MKSLRPATEARRQAADLLTTDPLGALAILDHALLHTSDEEEPRSVGGLARDAGAIASELGAFEQAVAYYERARTVFDDDGLLAYAIAELHGKLGDEEGALNALRLALRLGREQGDLDLVELSSKALQAYGQSSE